MFAGPIDFAAFPDPDPVAFFTPVTGGSVEFTGVSMYRLEDSKVVEIWDTRNTLGILHQLNPELGAGGHHH